METVQPADNSDPVAAADDGPSPQTEVSVERKIVYTADVHMVVEQFDPIPSQVHAVAEQHRGYIAKSNLRGRSGSPRSGDWTVRVPVANYAAFLESVRELGEVQYLRTDSQDVTAEFYDVEARIRNKTAEEERLRKHLDVSTGKLDDILQVEKELSRVRGEIEQMEGRMRVLSELTSLTTVDLSVEEVKDYIASGTASYVTRVRRAFSGSVSSLARTAQAVSIALVVAVPWLCVLSAFAAGGLLIRYVVRRVLSRSAGSSHAA